jgi:hypothetical protein
MATGIKILDAFVGVAGDLTEFDKSVEQSEQKALTMGQRISNALTPRNLFKAFAGAASAAFALASKEGLELSQTLNEVQSETGATGADWEAMQRVVQRENGRTTESLGEIGGAVIAMRQDLQLGAADIDKYADRFFNFGLVTKRGTTQAIKDVAAIRNAYHVDLDAAMRIVDELIASHEKYGGSLDDNLDVIARLAPALRTLNLTGDDGVRWLNFFRAKGLGASDALKALNSVVVRFKIPPSLREILGPPHRGRTSVKEARTEVHDMLAELRTFETPKAFAEIAKKVSAIKDPLARDLALQKLYAAEVKKFRADPLQRYLEIIAAIPDAQQRTQVAQALFGKKAGAAIANALATGDKALKDFGLTEEEIDHKGDEVAKHLDEGPLRSIKLFGEQVGALFASAGSNPIVTGIASIGTVLGGFAPNLTSKLAGGLIRGMKGVGLKMLAVIGIELAAGKAAEAGASVAADAVKGSLVSRLGGAGKLAGGALKLGMIGAAAGAVFAVYEGISGDLDKQTDALTTQTGQFVKSASLGALQNARQGVIDGMKNIPTLGPWDIFGGKDRLQQQLDQLDGEIEKRGKGLPAEAAAGIDANAPLVNEAMARLHSAITGQMQRTAEVARLKGYLAGDELARGLKSKDPVVRAQAQATKAIVEAQLNAIKAKAAGEKAAQALANAIAAWIKGPGRGIISGAVNFINNLLYGGTTGSKPKSKSGSSTSEYDHYDVGTPFVPRTQLALVHQGERILTTAENASPAARAAAVGALGEGGPLVGSMTIVNPAPEPASTSTSRELRKLAYLGSR